MERPDEKDHREGSAHPPSLYLLYTFPMPYPADPPSMAGLIFRTFFSLPKSREWPKDKSPLLGMECRVAQSSSSPLILLPFYISLTITLLIPRSH